MSVALSMPAYNPGFFRRQTTELARQIILTPEAGLTTNERWKREAPFLSELIQWPESTRMIVDFGCGVGRMCHVTRPAVLGVDFEASMRAQAEGEMDRAERKDCGFVSPEVLELLIERGFRAQGALAIWVLQHTAHPDRDVRLLFNVLPPGSPLYVVNRQERWVPCTQDGRNGWVDDGIDIREVVESGGFVLTHEEPMPETLCAPGAWFRKYERAAV